MQYLGNGKYKIYLEDNSTIELSESDIDTLQRIEFDGGIIEELKETVQDLKDEMYDKADEIDTALCEIEEILSSAETDKSDFNFSIQAITTQMTALKQLSR